MYLKQKKIDFLALFVLQFSKPCNFGQIRPYNMTKIGK